MQLWPHCGGGGGTYHTLYSKHMTHSDTFPLCGKVSWALPGASRAGVAIWATEYAAALLLLFYLSASDFG